MVFGTPARGRARGPLPIVVGVTGHRDIRPDDVPRLERVVREAFETLLNAYRSTPLLLLSPLAAGGDRIAARVAMDLGIPVVVPLPLEQNEYERDFDEAETSEFRAMLERARGMLPGARVAYFVGYAPGNRATNVEDPERRSRQYAQVGSYVARNCQILIALWNGLPSDAVGGTAQIVEFKRDGRTPGFGPEPRPLDRPEYGTLWQIVTPRAKSPDEFKGGEPFARVPRWRKRAKSRPVRKPGSGRREGPTDEEVTEAIYESIDRFNTDACGAGWDTGEIATSAILGAAERLAKRYQTRTLWTLRWLYLAGFLVTAAFLLYSHVRHDFWLLVLDVVLSVGALWAYFSAQNRLLQNSHLEYRAVAEGLRVQEQWHKAHLRETVADHYLRQHRGELDWIRNAIRTCRLLDDTANTDDAVPLETRREQLEAIYDDWIMHEKHGQIAYFEGRSDQDERDERRFNWASWIAAGISILATIAAALLFGPLHFPVETPPPEPHETPLWIAFIVTIAITAVASGLLASYAQKRAYGIHVKRYRRMITIFRQAARMLEKILRPGPFGEADYEAAQRVIRDLGEEALLENAAWVMLHRERPLEFVQGG